MTNTTQSCNACDTVDYDGELDDAGRCAQCVAEEREFVAHHNGGHTTAQCEQGQHDFQFPVDSYGVPMTTARYCSNCDTIESEPIMTTTTCEPTFTSRFPITAEPGDYIETEPDANGIVFRATIVRDDCDDSPDEHQDGFWPSLDPDNAGYIGEGQTSVDLAAHQCRAESVMEAYKQGEWGYVGVVVSSRSDGRGSSLWGIECNYPGSDNSYLLEVANDILPDARQFNEEAS